VQGVFKLWSALPRWVRITGTGLSVLALAFWLLARFWLPDFIRGKAEVALEEALHRPVSIGAIEIRPFAMSLTIRNFKVEGGQRTPTKEAPPPLAAFDEFHVDVSIASLWHKAPVISALRLVNPSGQVTREADGTLSIADLMGPPTEPSKDEKPAGPLPDFSVANVEISGGRFVFEDRLKGSRQEVGDLALGIPFAGTIDREEDIWVEPFFRATLDGAPFELKGKVKPFTDRREATLEVRLKDLDLTRFDEYAALPAGLKLLSARLDIHADVVFVQAPGQPMSLQVKGETALRRLGVENVGGAPYVATADRIVLKVDEFDAGLKKPIRAGLAIDALALKEKGAKANLVALPKFEAKGLALDLSKHEVDLAAVSLDGLRVALQRDADGRIDLLRVLVPKAPAAKSAGTDAAGTRSASTAPPVGKGSDKPHPPDGSSAAAAKGAAPAWHGTVGRIALDGAALSFTDRTLAKAVPLNVDALSVGVERLDLTGRKPAAVKFGASVNQRGRVDVAGTAAWAPLAVDLNLDLRELDLVPLQGWAGDVLNVLISRGNVSVGGKLALSGGGTQPVVARFDGDGRLAALNAFDRNNSTDLLSLKAIELSGVHFVSQPLAVELKRILLDEVFARGILGADGRLNFGLLVKNNPPPGSAAPQSPPPAPVADAAPAERKALPIRIGEIVLRKNRLDFTDRFIKPPYQATLTGLDGRIAPLEAGKRGLVELTGAVDRSAPLSISGEVDPFGSKTYLNIAARVKGVDLPNLSTYSERYVGYQLAKGKLSLDLRYFIEDRKLKAENKLFLDQLTFGDKVESPDAISAPVNLAVALLKNSKGEIDIDLPISGSLDDPEFSVVRIVFKVLGNLIVKAVASPFALLSSVFGGGEELSEVAFVHGRATPEPEGLQRLETLAKALKDRPALKLEVTGQADPDADRSALGRALLDRKLRARKLEETTGKGAESGALRDVVLSPEERLKYLGSMAKDEGIPLPKDAPDPAKAYEDALLAKQKVGDDELRALAERRGRSVRNWLVEQGGVPVERVFVMVPKVEAPDGKGVSRAAFSLR
jgi:uncharacterized protein involved in outer membrane biogenesis